MARRPSGCIAHFWQFLYPCGRVLSLGLSCDGSLKFSGGGGKYPLFVGRYCVVRLELTLKCIVVP